MSIGIQVIGKEALTMEYLCRVCGRHEGEPQGWHLVIELDKPGTAIRNTIFILDHWDEKQAHDPNSICFCSVACKDRYLAAWHQQLVA